jgi:hypothetical protein
MWNKQYQCTHYSVELKVYSNPKHAQLTMTSFLISSIQFLTSRDALCSESIRNDEHCHRLVKDSIVMASKTAVLLHRIRLRSFLRSATIIFKYISPYPPKASNNSERFIYKTNSCNIYTPDILWISLLSSFLTLFHAYNWLKIIKSIVPNEDQCRRASVLVNVSDFSEFYNDFQWFLMTSDSLGICFINSAIIHILNVLWWCQMISNKRNQFVPRCYTIQNGHSMNICNRDLP